MAVVSGTAFDDFIHRLGDGNIGPGTDITTVTAAADTITGGNGNDLIYADAGNDDVDAGNGNDVIFGGAGADILHGGIGSDTFRFQAGSEVSNLAETLDGGDDFDTIDLINLLGPLDLHLATINSVERLFLDGQPLTLTAAQLGGFQHIQSGGNFDRITLFSAGVVDLTGATVIGIDDFRGTNGADTYIFTGVETGQTVNALDGIDNLTGGNAGDSLNGGAGNDTVNAGLGNDALIGEDGNDTLNGEDGNDVITGGAGVDNLNGGTGNDTFRIGFVAEISGLAEVVNGGLDIDRLDFQQLNTLGAVNLSAATLTSIEELALAGNEVTLTAAQLGAFTTLTAGGNADRLILSAPGTVDLTGATIFGIDEIRGSAGSDAINLTNVINAQFVDGRAGNDVLTGGFGGDTLWGDIGIDTINGGDGNDTIRGGQSRDALNGGVGYDVFQIQQISDISGLAEIINGGNDVDRLDFAVLGAFGAVDLTLATLTSVEHLALNLNDVTLKAAQLGAFEIISSGGNLERIFLADAGNADLTNASITGIDEIRGSSGNDTITLTGVAAAQTLNGGFGSDTLRGGNGNDIISGEEGNDQLVGSNGNDTVTGGQGQDIFWFFTTLNASTNVDTVTDFTPLDDVMNLFRNVFTQIGVGTLTATAFVINTTGLAEDASDRIIYQSNTGNLFYDTNGNAAGGSTLFAHLDPNLALTVNDFVIL